MDDGKLCDPYQGCHPGGCSTTVVNHRGRNPHGGANWDVGPKEVTTAAPMGEPTGMLASAELFSKEVAPTREPTRELVMPMAADTEPVGAPPL